jgi:hypothetical protein
MAYLGHWPDWLESVPRRRLYWLLPPRSKQRLPKVGGPVEAYPVPWVTGSERHGPQRLETRPQANGRYGDHFAPYMILACIPSPIGQTKSLRQAIGHLVLATDAMLVFCLGLFLFGGGNGV